MDVHIKQKALLRHAAVSVVLAKVVAGVSTHVAVGEALQNGGIVLSNGQRIRVSRRTLFRWVADYKAGGFDALVPKSKKSNTPTRALPKAFMEFLIAQKTKDSEASIPDIISAARILEIIKEGEISRTSAWRAAVRLNLPVLNVQKKSNSTKRRFEYKHRMQMVFCDGKHFRAGVRKRKRVVFTFIDDSTRRVVGLSVCRSENKRDFLRGLYKVILRVGKMNCLFVDNGSGFISNDGYLICARLGINIINGTERYPEGHGKIERYNRTQYADLLRTLDGDPAIDASFASLELRIEHYAFEVYNNRHHESLGKSPNDKWRADSLPLQVIDNKEALAREFVITKTHKVSADNIVKVDGKLLEMPLGYAGTRVHIACDLLHSEARVLHEGKMILLNPVNLNDNAKTKRSGRLSITQKKKCALGPITTAARIAFEKDFPTMVNAAGDFMANKQP
jgi:transposase InsO family protein